MMLLSRVALIFMHSPILSRVPNLHKLSIQSRVAEETSR
jgi:hypothetical protein